MTLRKLFDGRRQSGRLYRITKRVTRTPAGKRKTTWRVEQVTATPKGTTIQ